MVSNNWIAALDSWRDRAWAADAEAGRLRAEVERLAADRAALVHRLEELMDRWGAERNTLVREIAADCSHGSGYTMVRSEMLLRCIEELNGAIPGT